MTQETVDRPQPASRGNKATCSYCLFLLLLMIAVLLTPVYWPWLVPFPLYHFWFWSGTPAEIALDALPFVLTYTSLSLLLLLLKRRRILAYLEESSSTWLPSPIRGILPLKMVWCKSTSNETRYADLLLRDPISILGTSLLKSFLGELVSYWLFFYGECIAFNLLNRISFGLVQWLYLNVFRPLWDVLTGFLLHSSLYQGSWTIGAVITMSWLLFYPYPHRKALRDFPFVLPFSWSVSFVYLLLLRHGLFPTLVISILDTLFIHLLVAHLLKPEQRQQEPQEGTSPTDLQP